MANHKTRSLAIPRRLILMAWAVLTIVACTADPEDEAASTRVHLVVNRAQLGKALQMELTVTSVGEPAFAPIQRARSPMESSELDVEVAVPAGVARRFEVRVMASQGAQSTIWRGCVVEDISRATTLFVRLFPEGGGNQAPTVRLLSDRTSAEGSGVALQVVANDPDCDPLRYSAVNLPAGLILNPEDGRILRTIDPGAATASPFPVTVEVSDGTARASTDFLWTITDATPPRFTNVAVDPTSACTGDTLSIAFMADGLLRDAPEVTVAGNRAALSRSAAGVHFTYTYRVRGTEPQGAVPIMVTGTDLAGNAGSATGTVQLDFTPPTFTNLLATPNPAAAGANLFITFTVMPDALLRGNPVVTVAGNPATFAGVQGQRFTYSYTVRGTEPQGAVPIMVTGTDLAGNAGSATGTAQLAFIASLFATSTVTPNLASAGVVLNLAVTASAVLQGNPVVTVAGNPATFAGVQGQRFLYTYRVQGTEPEGPARIIMRGTDLAGNAATTENTVLLDFTPPEVALDAVTLNIGVDGAAIRAPNGADDTVVGEFDITALLTQTSEPVPLTAPLFNIRYDAADYAAFIATTPQEVSLRILFNEVLSRTVPPPRATLTPAGEATVSGPVIVGQNATVTISNFQNVSTGSLLLLDGVLDAAGNRARGPTVMVNNVIPPFITQVTVSTDPAHPPLGLTIAFSKPVDISDIAAELRMDEETGVTTGRIRAGVTLGLDNAPTNPDVRLASQSITLSPDMKQVRINLSCSELIKIVPGTEITGEGITDRDANRNPVNGMPFNFDADGDGKIDNHARFVIRPENLFFSLRINGRPYCLI